MRFPHPSRAPRSAPACTCSPGPWWSPPARSWAEEGTTPSSWLAVKLADPTIKLADQELSREALQADFAEFDLGVLITVVVAVNPVLAVFAVPTVLLARRFIMHAQLLAQSRIDTKTGLLNASTWEREATVEIARAVRTGSPLALALVDIDHFKVVNDTYGHLAGDKALRAVTDALRSQLRSYDLAGRFGGEEFVVLLPQAREVDAINVAERLRAHIAALSIPVGDDAESGPSIKLTISVGVAALDGASRELTDMLAAADAALYYAKETGRNKTHVITATCTRLLAHPPPSAPASGTRTVLDAQTPLSWLTRANRRSDSRLFLPGTGQESCQTARPLVRSNTWLIPGPQSARDPRDPAGPFPQDLARYLAASTGLPHPTAVRVIADVATYFNETIEDFVRRRHAELRQRQRKNDEIWPLIAAELGQRRFAAPGLSERQLRRIVYG